MQSTYRIRTLKNVCKEPISNRIIEVNGEAQALSLSRAVTRCHETSSLVPGRTRYRRPARMPQASNKLKQAGYVTYLLIPRARIFLKRANPEITSSPLPL